MHLSAEEPEHKQGWAVSSLALKGTDEAATLEEANVPEGEVEVRDVVSAGGGVEVQDGRGAGVARMIAHMGTSKPGGRNT